MVTSNPSAPTPEAANRSGAHSQAARAGIPIGSGLLLVGVLVQARLAQVVDNGRECGETGAQVTSGSTAWRLWSLVQGLSMDLLHRADVPAVEVLSEASAQVFPNPCRRRGASLVR